MLHRRGVCATALATTALALILACVPSVAFGLEVQLGIIKGIADQDTILDIAGKFISPVTIGTIPGDCTIPAGLTSCTVTQTILAQPVTVSDPAAGNQWTFQIYSGGSVTATKIAGSINKVTLNNVQVVLKTASGPTALPVTFGLLFFHGFTGVNVTVPRAYAQSANGNLCNLVNNSCQNAAGDSVRLDSGVVYANNGANLSDVPAVGACIQAGNCQAPLGALTHSPNTPRYTVAPGGISLNNYFPESTLPSTAATASCTLGSCQSLEIVGSVLSLGLTNVNHGVVQKATHEAFSGPVTHEGTKFSNDDIAKSVAAGSGVLDVAQIFNLDSNDINLTSTGNKQVALVSQVDKTTNPPTIIFNPANVDLGSVRFSVGDGKPIAPFAIQRTTDVNKDGLDDIVFFVAIPDLAHSTPPSTCQVGGLGVGLAVLTATLTDGITSTTVPKPKGNNQPPPGCTLNSDNKTMTCIISVPVHAQEPITCAPQASGNP